MKKKLNNSRIIYKIKKYDLFIIEIKQEDGIECEYLELDYSYNEQNVNNLNKKLIYILQYQNGEDCQASFGQLITILNQTQYNIKHSCSTSYGSSGSPIILLESLKVIGFHLQRDSINNYNGGNFIFYAIDFFKNLYQQNIQYFPKESIPPEFNNNNERNTYFGNSSIILNNLNFTKKKSEPKFNCNYNDIIPQNFNFYIQNLNNTVKKNKSREYFTKKVNYESIQINISDDDDPNIIDSDEFEYFTIHNINTKKRKESKENIMISKDSSDFNINFPKNDEEPFIENLDKIIFNSKKEIKINNNTNNHLFPLQNTYNRKTNKIKNSKKNKNVNKNIPKIKVDLNLLDDIQIKNKSNRSQYQYNTIMNNNYKNNNKNYNKNNNDIKNNAKINIKKKIVRKKKSFKNDNIISNDIDIKSLNNLLLKKQLKFKY